MPAIIGLLPINTSQAVKKEGEPLRSKEPKADPVKEAVRPENKGSGKDKQATTLAEKKRFDEALQEKMHDSELQEKSVAQRHEERSERTDDLVNELAASGSALPSAGETLPIGAPEEAANHEAFDALSPQIEVAETDEQTSPLSPSITLIPAEETTIVDGEVLEVTAQDPLTTAPTNAQKEPILLAQEPVQQAPNPKSIPAADIQPNSPSVSPSEPEPLSDELAAAQVASPNAKPSSDLDPALIAQSQGKSAKADGTNETRPVIDQAERVRAWRGLNSQELQMTTTQPARQEAALTSASPEQSGQFQQFAQSLRLAVKQSDSAPIAASGERSVSGASASSASSGSESLTAWRTETSQAALPNTGARQGASSASFAQTMQASNFGQALGEKVGQNAWGESIAQRVTLMAGQKMSSAQIQLDPPELGAMTVKVTVNGDQANVSFHSAHAVVRDALEASFPRLQEMLGQQGIELADAQVSDQSSAEQDARGNASSVAGRDGLGSEEEGAVISSQTVHSATGLIDYYA